MSKSSCSPSTKQVKGQDGVAGSAGPAVSDYLSSFTLYVPHADKPTIFLTCNHKRATLSGDAFNALECPAHVQVFVGRGAKAKEVAFVPCSGNDSHAYRVHTGQGPKNVTNRNVLRLLQQLSGIQFSKQSVRFNGWFQADSNALVFDLSKPVQARRGRGRS